MKIKVHKWPTSTPKRCLMSLVFSNIEIKTIMSYISYNFFKEVLARMWSNWNPHTFMVGCKMVQLLQKTVWQFPIYIWNYHINQEFCSQIYTPSKTGNKCSDKSLSTYVCGSTYHNCQNEKRTQMFINQYAVTKYGIYSYNGLLFNHKKNEVLICQNTDKPLKHLKGKNANNKGHKLYDSIHMRYTKSGNPQRQKTDQCLPGAGERENKE